MNHFVPNFDMDKDYPIPGSSETPSSSQLKRTSTADEDILELLWHNGQPVALNQSQRLSKRSSPLEQSSSQLEQQQQQQQQQFFMHEDEMCSWLHYPLVEDSSSFDHNFCAADLLYPPPPPPPSSFHTTSAASTTTMATTTLPVPTSHVNMSEPKPPPQSYASSGGGGSFAKQSMPPSSLFSMPRTEPGPGPGPGPGLEPSLHNFGLFARHKAITVKPGPSSSKAAPLHTVVDSSETPLIEVDAAKQRSVEGEENLVGGIVGTGGSSAGGERGVCNAVVSSTSPRGSSVSGELGQKQHVDDRKRKGREIEEAEGQSEDVEFESTDTKKQARGSTSTKRSRAAEVHNLSERRRRDRINEKMRALQELIPRCNKSDKASMLDEAIEYLKSLQLQIQMMSMGYGMVPMMYPGIQQYMPPMGMGLGMGMNMEMGMNRPMMPYPNVLPNSAYPASGASAHMGPRHPMTPPPFHMQPAAVQDPSRFQNNQSIPMMNPVGAPYPIPPGVPFYTDPYQQYHGLPQQQIHLTQNQVMPPPSTSKPGSSGRTDDVDNPKSG